MTHDYDDTDAMLNEMMARGREVQNSAFRARDVQIEDLANQFGEEGTFTFVDDRDAATKHILEAEARGAAEQRQKGAEIAGYIPANTPNFFALSEAKHTSTAMHKEPSPGDVPVYYSANVDALEARIAELEEAATDAIALIRAGRPVLARTALCRVTTDRAALTREGGPA